MTNKNKNKNKAVAASVSASAEGGGWSAVFGCTYEGIALFRIVVGILLTSELILRFRFLHVFYTDEGTMPLRLLVPKIDTVYRLVCYHCHFETLFAQQLLLSLQVVVAICFTIGYYTKVTSILSFYMYTSLILRCTWLYFILDRYFYYLLFYAMFLPLSQKLSVDQYLDDTKKKYQRNENNNDATNTTTTSSVSVLFVNPATVALKLLVLWIYLDAGVNKYLDPQEGWTYHADPLPALDTYARHTIGAQYLYTLLGPQGLRFLTPLVVYTEIGCVPLASIGAYFQHTKLVNLTIILIVGMHLGISICIRNSNLLSYIATSVWILFVPIDTFRRKQQQKNDNDGSSGDRDITTSAHDSTTRSSSSSSRSNRNRIGSVLTYLLVGGMVGGNIWFETIGTDCSTESSRLIWSTLLQNRWNVFIGAEEYVTWEIAPGRLQDGSVVDVWGRTDVVNWNMPGSGAPCTSTARPGRWRSFPYLADLEGDDAEALWGYLCREWDRENNVGKNGTGNPGRQLLRYNFFMLQADVLPNMGFSSTRKRLVHSYECVKEKEKEQETIDNENENENDGKRSAVEQESRSGGATIATKQEL